MLFEIDDADVRALFGQGNRDGAADTAVATSDNCDFAPAICRFRVGFILRLGERLHFMLEPRTLLLMLRRLALFPPSARLTAVVNFSRKIRPAG